MIKTLASSFYLSKYYKLNLKKDQSMKKNQNKKRANIVDPQSSNPVRAVFLEGPGSETKSSSGGTGVFLPKKIGHASESRKKQGTENWNSRFNILFRF